MNNEWILQYLNNYPKQSFSQFLKNNPEQWILKYLQSYPKQSFFQFLQSNREQSKVILNIDYSDLNDFIKKLKSFHQQEKDDLSGSQLSLEEQIILILIFLTQDLDSYTLSELFDVSESTVQSICSCWKIIFQRNHLPWHKRNIEKRIRITGTTNSQKAEEIVLPAKNEFTNRVDDSKLPSKDRYVGRSLPWSSPSNNFTGLASSSNEDGYDRSDDCEDFADPIDDYDDDLYAGPCDCDNFGSGGGDPTDPYNDQFTGPRGDSKNLAEDYLVEILALTNKYGYAGSVGDLKNLVRNYLPDFLTSRDKLDNFAPISPSLPLNKKTKLLPHDGLFIRRNNQFGKSDKAIKDLIDQGSLFDQTDIRFDDFIASNSERVPSPQADSSIAVSYGIASIPFNNKRDQRATHYLEIALKTPDISPVKHPVTQTLPVNYIFVVDISGSMAGDKLDNVKASIRELFTRMSENDFIGIIGFNSQPKTLLRATSKEKIKLDEFSQILSNLTANGGTDINIAISFGIDEIRRYGNNNTLNHIYLFSDGNPNSGETNWIKIRQNVDTKTRGNTRLSTFAYGSDANTRELDALAGLTGGKSTFVSHPDDIRISLQEEFSRREYLAAINVQMQIEIDRDIKILYLYGHDQITDPAAKVAVLQNVESAKNTAEKEFGVKSKPDLITKEKGIKIFVPDLAVGETYWVVFELAIPEEKTQTSIGKATVQYVDTFVRESQKSELELSFTGNLPSDLVVEHGLALWTSEIAFYVLDYLYEEDIDTAKKCIENHIDLLSNANHYLSSASLPDDITTLRKLLSLTENLGSFRSFSDTSPGNCLKHSLNALGKVKNGFNRVDYSINR